MRGCVDLRSELVETPGGVEDKVSAGDMGLVLTLYLYSTQYKQSGDRGDRGGWSHSPRAILRPLPGAGIRIKVLQVGGLLLLAALTAGA